MYYRVVRMETIVDSGDAAWPGYPREHSYWKKGTGVDFLFHQQKHMPK